MAAGTGNLPNQNMVFTPFDILTAEEQNQLVENIESLATGLGIGDWAITPDKRSGGYATGVIDVTSTGIKTISGLDFEPKYIKFKCGDNTSSRFQLSNGYMDANNQYVIGGLQGVAEGQVISSYSTSRCIQAFSTPAGTASIVCTGVRGSINPDGFSVNITLASSVPIVIYEAFG